MSEVEEINLESNIKKPRHQKQQNQSRRIRKTKNNFNRPRDNSQNRNRDKQRRNDWRQQNGANPRDLYEIDIYNFLAKNQISDLMVFRLPQVRVIQDLDAGIWLNFILLPIIYKKTRRKQKQIFTTLKVVLKAFFKDKKSADECEFQYNDAKLDDLSLRTERKY